MLISAGRRLCCWQHWSEQLWPRGRLDLSTDSLKQHIFCHSLGGFHTPFRTRLFHDGSTPVFFFSAYVAQPAYGPSPTWFVLRHERRRLWLGRTHARHSKCVSCHVHQLLWQNKAVCISRSGFLFQIDVLLSFPADLFCVWKQVYNPMRFVIRRHLVLSCNCSVSFPPRGYDGVGLRLDASKINSIHISQLTCK